MQRQRENSCQFIKQTTYMNRRITMPGIIVLMVVLFFSCEKNKETSASTFYGKWKASYGDTIEFFYSGGKNVLYYDQSMSPAVLLPAAYEYTYRNGKLGVKDGLSGLADFRIYQSFRWIQEGQSFEVQGVEWFPFISSTLTYFTFTRLR